MNEEIQSIGAIELGLYLDALLTGRPTKKLFVSWDLVHWQGGIATRIEVELIDEKPTLRIIFEGEGKELLVSPSPITGDFSIKVFQRRGEWIRVYGVLPQCRAVSLNLEIPLA